MTLEEAIELLNDVQTDTVYRISKAESVAVDVAIEALEKQIPKKPKETLKGICCPVCGGVSVTDYEEGYVHNHCHSCGQKIDWSDEE